MRTALRRTKIIATLGPASDQPGVLMAMLVAGVDAVRLNFSHGCAADHQRRAAEVRQASLTLHKEVAIIADLQGPKIRVARFANGSVHLEKGQSFILDAALAKEAGDDQRVGIDYPALPQDVKPDDRLLLDDGRLVFRVERVDGAQIFCEVLVGGELSNNKGINRQGGGLSAKALTDKDKEDLMTAVGLGADYIAISFPRCAADIVEAQDLIAKANGSAGVIAKIERAEALDELDNIITAAAAVMVARGDLGVEIGDALLPEAQKRIIHRARCLDKPVITATQMMETMITNAIPTRAEVFDVANAVLDGTDAVMLSAETASGKHPVLVIEAMSRVCLGAEQQSSTRVSNHRVECYFSKVEEVIAMAAMYAANHFDIQAIVALTESGATALWMSRLRSGIPIFGMTRHVDTQRRMTLYRGVYPINCTEQFANIAANDVQTTAILKNQGTVKSGDYVLVTHGDAAGQAGGTNTLRILQVP